ncbi:hypothetical protein ATY41_10295 [Leifsonia xyli subsp. xyli]|uniref:Condensation domain-containing protein n=2 Tax=Leifsonia xyli TaxID=1575 RepID=A0A1E2SKW3_LEIXY|nr:hypothetical protein ATY41_10295 [Leifsonia xyli subsp. xyli]
MHDRVLSWEEIRAFVGDSIFFAADLEEGPLAWADAFITRQGGWVALIVFDHVAADGYSLDVFERALLGHMQGRDRSPISPSIPRQKALSTSEEYKVAANHYQRLWSEDYERPAYLESHPSPEPIEHRFAINGQRYQLMTALAEQMNVNVAQLPQLLVASWLAELFGQDFLHGGSSSRTSSGNFGSRRRPRLVRLSESHQQHARFADRGG